MNDAYPEGFPRYASRVQLAGDDGPARNATTEEDDTAAETPLPVCNGSNGIKGVDCRKAKLLKMCPGNMEPKLQAGEEKNCRIMKLCSANPGLAPGTECYQAGHMGLVQ